MALFCPPSQWPLRLSAENIMQVMTFDGDDDAGNDAQDAKSIISWVNRRLLAVQWHLAVAPAKNLIGHTFWRISYGHQTSDIATVKVVQLV